ncbi:MAG: hypothetical protein M1834_009614 [Cirrosporium novae-zelandiae]|nr:MAG: hypothetical protein M1834_009614 [Cirrosporium novae-zelandiae]
MKGFWSISSLGMVGMVLFGVAHAIATPSQYDVVWTTQSSNHSWDSMPFGGGDLGCNAWVENDTILFYFAKSGTWDDANTLVKLGRVRLDLDPNPFTNSSFEQRLVLHDGYIKITGGNNTTIKLWVDVHSSIIHADIDSPTAIDLTASYETWRYRDRQMNATGGEQDQSSWDTATEIDNKTINATTYKDNISYSNNGILMYHHNRNYTMFNFTVEYELLGDYIDQMYNPLASNTYGFWMYGNGLLPTNKTTSGVYINTDYKRWSLKSFKPQASFNLAITTYVNQTSVADLEKKVASIASTSAANSQNSSIAWWHKFWDRSYIFINTDAGSNDASFQVGKNYNIFRYMMGCNAFSEWPMKFNGGLYTFDPYGVESDTPWTPDFRKWTSSLHTQQNQRLLHWPLLKSGDLDILKANFEFYKRITPNAQLRGRVYFGINHTVFTEQIENFGLPNYVEWNGRLFYDDVARSVAPLYPLGVDWNRWLSYLFDTANESADMILLANQYHGFDVTPYLNFIENQLMWYDVYYQYLQQNRDALPLSGQGDVVEEEVKLVIYPGSGQEAYKGTYNAASTVSGLRKVISDLLSVNPDYEIGNKSYYESYYNRIPDTPIRTVGTWEKNWTAIAPAQAYARIQNTEIVSCYPVFPWGEYGLGKPNLTYAINAYLHDPEVQTFRAIKGWKQDPIWVARLGLSDLAQEYITEKLADSTAYRFPAFWGPNYDWSPDMNHGGSAMIALQEMLMQTDNYTIRLLPTWPSNWTTKFKLHAPYNTTVSGTVRNGNISDLVIEPASRKGDVVWGQN